MRVNHFPEKEMNEILRDLSKSRQQVYQLLRMSQQQFFNYLKFKPKINLHASQK